jgi:LacI family transcriptional regulator
MRQRRTSASSRRQPLVGIAVEAVTTYGRSVLRGVLKYANLQRKWLLHKDIWSVTGNTVPWPRCDGTIIAGIGAGIFSQVQAKSRLMVTCSGSYGPDVPAIVLDDAATASMAADHLIDCGLRHFAYYAATGGLRYMRTANDVTARRGRGFERALKDRGFNCLIAELPLPTHEDLLTHRHHPMLIAWLQSLPKPIGIMAADDMLANDLAAACHAANIGVPDHIAIIGVNNDDLLCESAWPPISSVEVDFSRMGYLAAKTLDRLLSGEKLGADEHRVELPPIRVHQRMSTDVLASELPDVANAIRYIRQHACDPCTVDDVLREVPVTRRTLERQFAQQLGRSPYDEIAKVRVETARRLLLQPDMPIPTIAERCGYSAVQSFNRAFLQRAGITPAAFRRQSLKGQMARLLK